MPEKVEIFVASSHHAKQEAETLATELTKYEDQYSRYTLHATTWFDRGSIFINILDDLLDKTATYDFAVIVLTSRLEENSSIPSETENEKRRMRYNTIYEAGLFGGALGPECLSENILNRLNHL